MKVINSQRFELTTRDFRGIGTLLEDLMAKVIQCDYGFYPLDPEHYEMKAAVLILENMITWQEQHNKGVELTGGYKYFKLRIYDYMAQREKLNSFTSTFFISTKRKSAGD